MTKGTYKSEYYINGSVHNGGNFMAKALELPPSHAKS